MIDTVTCTNPDCPEFNVVKTNTSPDLGVETVEEIICGGCGGPVAEAVE